MSDIDERLTEYCLHGGLYNSELMQHEKVRDLLIDCRSEIASLRLTDDERAAVMAAWRESYSGGPLWNHAATLRGLLERTGGAR